MKLPARSFAMMVGALALLGQAQAGSHRQPAQVDKFSFSSCLVEQQSAKADEISLGILSDQPPTFRFAPTEPCVLRAKEAGVTLTDDYLLAVAVKLGELRQDRLAKCVISRLSPEALDGLKKVWRKGEEAAGRFVRAGTFVGTVRQQITDCDAPFAAVVLGNDYLLYRNFQLMIANS